MKNLTQTIILLIAVGYLSITATAQGWQPAVQIADARLDINIITLPDGTTLVPVSNMLPNQKDTILFFSVESLLTDREPWPQQLPGKVMNIEGVYNSNGNEFADVIMNAFGETHVIVLDLFSEHQRTRNTFPPGGVQPAFSSMITEQLDYDGDGYEDELSVRKGDQFSRITFGDRDEPYAEHGVALANYQRKNDWRPYILAVGRLSGKTCMLQIAFKEEDSDSGYYQLLELNQADIEARRDTIRTVVLHELLNTSKLFFNTKVLKADTVWHLFHGGLSSDRYALKVTSTTASIGRTESRIAMGDHKFMFGQAKTVGEWNYPVTMTADRPIAYEVYIPANYGTDTLHRLAVAYGRCQDSDDASIEELSWAMLPLSGTRGIGGINTVVMIPDYDGDGMEDMLVRHGWFDPQTEEAKASISIFLTTQMVAVSVETNADPIQTQPDCQWTQRTGPVFIYNVLGEQVAVLTLTNNTIAPSDLEALPQQPLWAVREGCVRRVR